MTTRALEELDGGLGSCQVDEDLSALADPSPGRPQEDRAQATSRLADANSWPRDSQEPAAEGSATGSVDAGPKKTEKEPVTKVASGPGKERLKAGATPRSPARKKAQAAPPPQPPPPPPPAPGQELPWGDLTLNKCLVLASLVALLGSAFQLCRDAVAGEAQAPVPVPEPWVPPSSAPKEPALPLPKPVAWAPPLGPPEPPAKLEERAEVPGSREAARKDKGESEEGAEKERVSLADRGPKERRKKERPKKERPKKERPRKEKPQKEGPQKEERPRREKPRKEERPRAAREPRGALPRRWEAREGGRRPWARDSGDSEHRKRQAWGSPRRPDEEDRPPGRQKQRAGKGRD